MTRTHPRMLALLAVVVAVSAAAGYGLVRHDSRSQRMVVLADVHHYSVSQIRATFAQHGIRLRYASHVIPGVWLSATPFPVSVAALYVQVAQAYARMNWGPKPSDAFEQTAGNLLVHYGGSNPRILAEVRAAVADFR